MSFTKKGSKNNEWFLQTKNEIINTWNDAYEECINMINNIMKLL